MKKSFGFYSLIWAIALAVFNVIAFVTPGEIAGISKFDNSFWVGYIFITVLFVCQLACAFAAFRSGGLKKFFYNIPLLSISYGGLVAMLVVGSIFMAIPVLPEWIAIVACVIVLAVNAVAVVKAVTAADIVCGIDERVAVKTLFIKSLASEAQSLVAAAKTDALRAAAKQVHEEIRYSDPVTHPALAAEDARLEKQFAAFAEAVRGEDESLATETATAVIEAVKARNEKCRIMK